ncbi:MAG: M48 family metallopeptidase [Anaerolineales bacterium]|nr:M48 family metallopeptidase [Anaerolineales bacterium]
MRTTAYRYPNEQLILTLTLLLVFAVIALTATATLCASLVFIIAFVVLSYYMGRSHHQALVRNAARVTPAATPGLERVVARGLARLQPGEVEVYVLPSQQLNAYTFGLSSPKVVVLYSTLLKVMDEDEVLFILGHELGHVALGHTWLNSLIGGIAGIPASFSAAAILSMAFLWWNRSCEYSADRAGLLACGKPEKAVTALVKLAAGPRAASNADLERLYRQIDAEDDTAWSNLAEALGTHPMLINRIEQLRSYAGSGQYRRLQDRVARNG